MAAQAGGRRRFVTDPRFLIGVALVIASIAGVWWVVAAADRTTQAYATRATLPAGATVHADDLVATRVRLAGAERLYLTAVPADGAVVTRTVAAGELVPASAVREGEPQSTSVVVPARSPLPTAVTAGATVDVWAAKRLEHDGFGPPAVLVQSATVIAVNQADGLVADRSTVAVEIRVPARKVAAVLAALTGGDSVAVLPAGFGAGG